MDTNTTPLPVIGKPCVVRTYSAGVHIGTVTSLEGKQAVLKDSRRLWRWEGAFTLSEIAQKGCGKESRLAVTVPDLVLTEAIELIPMSEEAAEQISKIPAYDPTV